MAPAYSTGPGTSAPGRDTTMRGGALPHEENLMRAVPRPLV
jgi:hypothetical protein